MQFALTAYQSRKKAVDVQREEVRDLRDIDGLPTLGLPRLGEQRGRCHNFATALELLIAEQEALEGPLRALTDAAGASAAAEHARTAPERQRGLDLHRAEQAMMATTCKMVDLLVDHPRDWEPAGEGRIAFAEDAQIAEWDRLYAERNQHAERYNALATAGAR